MGPEFLESMYIKYTEYKDGLNDFLKQHLALGNFVDLVQVKCYLITSSQKCSKGFTDQKKH